MGSILEVKKKLNIDSKGIEEGRVARRKKPKKVHKIKEIKLISVDIGSKYIKVVEAKRKANIITVTNSFKVESPREIIEKGEIRNLPSIANTLKETFLKRHISTKDISFTGVSESVISREIAIIDSNQITDAERKVLVQNELSRYLPINLDDYEVQFTDAGRFEDNGVKKMKILVIVYPIRLIKSYLSLVKDIGSKMRPCSLDVTNNSLQKMFNHVSVINGKEINKESVYLFLDMGATVFNSSIIKDGKLEFMRLIPAGGEEIDKRIAFKIGMTIEEAEVEKIERGNLNDEVLAKKDEEVNKHIKFVVNGWLDEIERIIQFYSNKAQQRIDKIYIYGGSSKLKGLESYMNSRIGIEVEKIESFDGVELARNVNMANMDQFINTLGTVIRF